MAGLQLLKQRDVMILKTPAIAVPGRPGRRINGLLGFALHRQTHGFQRIGDLPGFLLAEHFAGGVRKTSSQVPIGCSPTSIMSTRLSCRDSYSAPIRRAVRQLASGCRYTSVFAPVIDIDLHSALVGGCGGRTSKHRITECAHRRCGKPAQR